MALHTMSAAHFEIFCTVSYTTDVTSLELTIFDVTRRRCVASFQGSAELDGTSTESEFICFLN